MYLASILRLRSAGAVLALAFLAWADASLPLALAYLLALLLAAMDRLGGEALATLVDGVCAAHTRVIPAESYTALGDPDARVRAIAGLQQKARWLEAEIAERRRAEERLRDALASERAAREAAEAALRVRDAFLSLAAHELRTPLTVVKAYIQMLRRALDPAKLNREQARGVVAQLEAATQRLLDLASELLDVWRLEAGWLELRREPTDLIALAEEVASRLRATASERHTRDFPPQGFVFS